MLVASFSCAVAPLTGFVAPNSIAVTVVAIGRLGEMNPKKPDFSPKPDIPADHTCILIFTQLACPMIWKAEKTMPITLSEAPWVLCGYAKVLKP